MPENEVPLEGRVLIVCTGNVCRSPYIELRLRQLLGPGPITLFSRGTRALIGQPVEPNIASALAVRGVDAAGFVARQLNVADVQAADLIVTATRAHRAEAVRLSPPAMTRTFALLDLVQLVRAASVSTHSPDLDPDQNWIAHVTSRLAAKRGFIPSRSDEETNLVDPFGAPPRVMARMITQAECALPVLADILRPKRAFRHGRRR